jgi:hypothetical protein
MSFSLQPGGGTPSAASYLIELCECELLGGNADAWCAYRPELHGAKAACLPLMQEAPPLIVKPIICRRGCMYVYILYISVEGGLK